jgi:hypothetical protein
MPIAKADRLTHVSAAPAPPGVPYPGEIEGLRAQQRLRTTGSRSRVPRGKSCALAREYRLDTGLGLA